MAHTHHRKSAKVKEEHWMNSKWRPLMGWMYMLVCSMDFVGFPILWSILQAYAHGQINSQWQPLTLQGAGLFHVAMGAVLGITAYGRTQEKMSGVENGGAGGFGPGMGTTYIPPGQGQVNVSNQSIPNFNNNNSFASPGMNNTTAFGSSSMSSNTNSFSQPEGFNSSGFNSTPISNNTPAMSAFGNKPAGPPQSFPEI
jgi:hypothetical protein